MAEELETVLGQQLCQPPRSVASLKFKDVLNFLQQRETACPEVQMVCHFSGQPLPYINIQLSEEAGAKIELSLKLCEALLKYTSRIAPIEVA